ncbi:MAG: DsbA family protein [Acidobacteria bacterium]|nr:DsbA family protein [Acidobacteriota bacterium]
MRNLLLLSAVLFTGLVHAQKSPETLAAATGASFTVESLSPEAQKLYANRDRLISETRSRLFREMIGDELIAIDAKSRNVAIEKFIVDARRQIPKPTELQIQGVYDANRQTLDGRPLAEVRTQIVAYLEQESEKALFDGLSKTLGEKYKLTLGKDVNSPVLKPTDVLAAIGTRKITAQEFESSNKFEVADTRAAIYEELRAELESSILSTLVKREAETRNIDAAAFIAAEVTNKLRAFTNEERVFIEEDLQNRLFAKYKVRILLTEPEPLVQNISADDDPAIGKATAPVTVIMFSDFQCPACARTHPILKKVIAEYGERVRFVVRDFPLRTIHKNAMPAAIAAAAAHKQGKFTEYTEILYRNQENFERASLVKYAGEIGLNVKQFELDLADPRLSAEIEKDFADGKTYGISGTPAIFVNGVKVHRLSAAAFRRAIDRAAR